ncbi:MAG: hypothetical protein ACOYVK_08870 [Bacillota bacterium]
MCNYDPEYHAFGPWIIEISQKHPLPPLFVPYYKETDDYLMLVKIPRNIDRRDAKPGMNLYDYVIGMYEDFIYILERKDNIVEETKLAYGEIEGIHILNDLLLGELTLYLTNRVIKIRYNTVSQDLITKLIKIIRDRYTNNIYRKVKNAYELNELKKTDVLFSNLLNEMEKNDDTFNMIIVQPTTKLKSKNDNILQKIFRIITGEKLLNCLHLINEKELVVVTRGKLIKKRKDVIYSYSLTYIPLEKLHDVVRSNDAHYNNLKKLHFKTYNHAFMFYYEEGNKQIEEIYRDFISMTRTSNIK